LWYLRIKHCVKFIFSKIIKIFNKLLQSQS
jgi:hypothetical protein